MELILVVPENINDKQEVEMVIGAVVVGGK
jgi:hypothetical protein